MIQLLPERANLKYLSLGFAMHGGERLEMERYLSETRIFVLAGSVMAITVQPIPRMCMGAPAYGKEGRPKPARQAGAILAFRRLQWLV